MFKFLKLYQQRDFGDIINVSFMFLRQNFKPLFRAHLYINGPLLIFLVALVVGAQAYIGFDFQSVFDDEGMAWYKSTTDYWASTAISVIGFMVFYISVYLVTVSYFHLYQNSANQEASNISPADVRTNMSSKIGAATGGTLLYFLAVIIGAMLCGIPGFFAMVAFWLFMPCIFFDNKGGYDSLARSYEIIKGNWWFTFGIFLVIGIIASLIGLVINMPSIIFGAVIAYFGTSDPTQLQEYGPSFYLWSSVIFSVLEYISNMLNYTIVAIATCFHFGTLVEEKEARGLVADIDNVLDEPTAPEY